MSVLILAEHDGHHIKQSTRQLVTAAGAWQQDVHLLLVGGDLSAVVDEAAAIAGVSRVLRVEAPHLTHVLAEDVAAALLQNAAGYSVILAAHSTLGKGALPRTAALLGVGMVSDVVSIQAPDTYVRPTYAGNVLATVKNAHALQVVSVRTTAFTPAANAGVAEIVSAAVPAPFGKARWVSEHKTVSERPELATASVVISGGRSLGEQFNPLLDPVAKKLNAAIGATRACVDAGFAPNDLQVGQTGTVVAPDLYIAIGISGAMQHLAGIKDSKVIVAINHDPDAPIFKHADYGLVADLFQAVPALDAALAAG
ncbi:electron transfer flavoprotein subunit alpha/FixB family protein [Pseudomethylobacillus aquaticus]|uniref:Electron transfer flavoprotein subunit alpha n=1 Tax=Pseudomethylobacillus aquaticus TaxID=2676064 RepID=A0A3N0V2M5_9PROT|nr:FAD-binding protein [Pseudomethylobacillus aquaticus]ROH87029.1 electron transfer flavoprotein subunit alpha/FixB family protein [Pseudomethylobacillus aquaticus]